MVSTNKSALALRVVTTAYLRFAVSLGGFIDVPDPNMEVEAGLVLPQGPPQDPNLPLLADDQVFATHNRHSDFDRATLVRDRARALQFFRWHTHVQQRCSKLVAHPNDTLTAVTGEVGQYVSPHLRPIFPFDVDANDEIPTDTGVHLKATQRESPLVAAGIAAMFERSKSFTLKVQNVIAKGTVRGICTVYRCQITSIDGAPVSVPSLSLCLKLFDDRFQPLEGPDLEEESETEAFGESDEHLPRWFDQVVVAEMYALNEAFAYDKLRPVQGSVFPWFYGAHQVNSASLTSRRRVVFTYLCSFDSLL